jgi:hypothetical protein
MPQAEYGKCFLVTRRRLCLGVGVIFVFLVAYAYYGLPAKNSAYAALVRKYGAAAVEAAVRNEPQQLLRDHPRSSPATLLQAVVDAAVTLYQGRRWQKNPDGEATINPFPLDVEFVVHNPDLCRSPSNQPVDWLIYFHSKPDNAEKRQLLRNSWASEYLLNGTRTKRAFMVGMPQGRPEEQRIFSSLMEEFVQHRDLVVGNFLDSYNNLTLKSIMAMKWISTYCANAKQAVKADDDVFVNIVELTSLVSSQPDQSHMITCPVFYEHTMPILRDPNSCMKWCAVPTDFPGDTTYPQYCSGTAYVISVDLTGDLYHAALRTRFFFIDDVYTTGLVPLKLPYKIRYVDFRFDWDGANTKKDYTQDGKANILAIMTGQPDQYNYYLNRSLHKLTADQLQRVNSTVLLAHKVLV